MSQGKIHIKTPKGLEVWTWRHSGFHTVIRDPDRKSYVVDQSILTGVSWANIERSHWKGGTAHEFGPAVVREYIENVIKKRRHVTKGPARRHGPKDWTPHAQDPGRFRG